ncbi:MAG: O-methyltransferase [Candidatus Zixiibacteriota bacterium]
MTDDFTITNPSVHAYLERVRPEPDPVLQEMGELAESRKFPYLGVQCSRLLHMLVRTSNARRVFELGSGFGYTMYWMAKAMTDGGLVIGTENSEPNVRQANAFFERGGITERTDIRLGDALTILETESGPFDLIFCDIEKDEYVRALELAKPRLRVGGLFVADNLLRGGKVVDPQITDPATECIREFTTKIYTDSDWFSTIIPLRDGLSISVKLASQP